MKRSYVSSSPAAMARAPNQALYAACLETVAPVIRGYREGAEKVGVTLRGARCEVGDSYCNMLIVIAIQRAAAVAF